MAAQTLYDDQTIGAHGMDIITTLIQWIRSGFSPTNEALALAGSDGQDIGAVAATFMAPVFPAPGSSIFGGVTFRGVAKRGVVIR